MSESILSIDLGTTHCRVSLHNPGSRVTAHAARECPVIRDASGMAEQDADEI